ncbi:putative polyketide synthase [Cavenderia fasciculata]|uniref:Polyketide synthase n=1 Tax=Cavenderia fasciculata TaxID=261658 RepID=F4Q8K0_CACFS|nr:putative polyketide synthase [Cavenderia fasciculata]EGG16100.1 putative polyketide synthase [Cavenderia fasciculata]|eukprot:XP_004352425.1 putative polyketide synthase [Cavenderia fasciculata]
MNQWLVEYSTVDPLLTSSSSPFSLLDDDDNDDEDRNRVTSVLLKQTNNSKQQMSIESNNNNNNNNNNQHYIDEDGVALIGIGCRFPGGSTTPQQFYDQLLGGLDGISSVTAERWSKSFQDQGFVATERGGFLDWSQWTNFDNSFFGILPKEATLVDPQVRLYLQVIWEALEDAHIDPATIRGSTTSTFLGQMYDSILNMQNRDLTTMSHSARFGRSDSSIKASYHYDFRGESIAVDTACSSSMIAILMGVDTIRSGKSDISIVAGVNATLEPTVSTAFTYMNMLGKKGLCASFDESAEGYARSEGLGVLILKRLSKAIADNDNIYCVVKGGSSNVDGNFDKPSPSAPSAAAQEVNTRQALKNVGLTPSDIYYVECHGTGTPTGDPMEMSSITKIFRGSHTKDEPLRIGSVKSNIGHTESAAAVASLIKCAMMIKNKMLVKNINFKKLNPKIDLLDGEIKIVLENEPIPTYYDDKLIRMGINSFGITGSNSHLIIEEFKSNKLHQEENNNTIEKIDYLIPFSANTKKSMDKYIELVKNNIDDYKEKVRFEDFVKTQSLKTRHPSCQKVIVASDWESFKESSRIYERQQTFASNMSQLNKKKVPQVVMVFCGQGAQWNGMGEKLYANEKVFRQAVDQVDQILSQHYQYSIIAKLRLADSQQIHHPILAQPSTFIIQVALVQLYKHFGVIPQIVIGHSFGDVTAAWCSGIISLEEACRIVYVRSVAQNDTIGSGRMLSVSLSVEQYNERFQSSSSSSSFDDISIACYNSADSIVLAGNEEQLGSIDQQLKNDNIFSAFLGTPCAFHTDKQDATKEYIFSQLEHINYQQSTPSIKYYSTSTSQLINSSTGFNAQYIFDNLRHPVLFQQSIDTIIANEHNTNNSSFVYLEIAPHTTLSFYLKTLLSGQPQGSVTIMSPLNRKKDEVECIQSCLSHLYFGHVNVDFFNQVSSSSDNEWKDRSRLLPRYQWDAEYHWDEQKSYAKIRLGGVSTTILGIRESPSLYVYEAGIDVNRPSYQYLKGHKVKGKYLFPGTGYIENILTAWPGKDVTIHNLNFINPFFLKEGVESKLKTTFTSYSATEFQVRTEFLDNASSKWIKASVGRISVRNPSTPEAKYPSVEQLRKDTYNVATRTPTDVYDKLIKLGLPYGETFKRVLQIQLNKDRGMLSEVDVQPRNHFEEENTVFNASILDCILHSGLTNFQGEGPNSEKVFEGVQGAQFFANNIPKCGTVKSLFIISKRGSQNIQRGNEHIARGYDIIDQDGNILANCGDLITTSLTKVCKTHQAKFPAKQIKESVTQPKNSPSLVLFNQEDNVVSLVQSFIESSKSSSHKVIRILNCMEQGNEILAFDIAAMIQASLENDNNIAVVDYNLIDRVGDMDSYFPNFIHDDKISMKLTKDIDFGEKLTDQGFLSSCYDLILTTIGDLKQPHQQQQLQQQFHQLLNLNGHLIILNQKQTADQIVDESQSENINNNQLEEIKSNLIDFIHVYQNNNLLVSRKKSIFEMELEKIDHILFITPSSSSSSSSSSPSSEEIQQLSTKLIQQANLITLDISFFSSNDIMDDNKNQQLIDAIGYCSSENKKVVILDISTLDPMNVDNLVSKSMEYLRLQQIIRREKLQIKLISLRTSTLNDCLSPISREFNFKSGSGLFSFESLALSISKDACNHVSIKQILQISNYQALGEGEFKLELDENEMVQVNVERLVYARDVLKPDSRFTVTDPKEMVIKFEKDSRYHLRAKQEVLTGEQVEIKVMAASLNFKDCLILDGGVPQSLFPSGDVYDPPFGQDCAGIVTRVGPKVTKFKVGDEVYGAASGSFTSHVITDQRILSIPKGLSFADAASIVTTMGTAHYALYRKGNIDPDDSVIIHSASGGVGLAALNILKTMGHRGKVFATIGSAGGKMQYLKDTYGSFITAILLSSNFTQNVLDMTDGEGVQYILNTLDHSRMQDNFSALSPSGTILDLSIDQFANLDNIGTHMLRYQRAYIAIHFSKNHYSSQCAVREMFNLGLQVPPIKIFPCQDITKAMDLMKSRTHIGKVILDFEHVERDLLPSLQNAGKSEAIIERHSYELDGVQGTLMMTGQTGVAAECLYYLIGHAPKLSNIIIVTHSKPKFEMQWLMHTIQSQNPHLTLHFIQCNISNYDQLRLSVKQLYESNTTIEPVKVLLHCANQYMATTADDITLEDHQQALSAKAIGAWNLHHLFEELGWKLNHFHLFSSMAQYLVKGNTSYGVGNAFLDGLARHRRECGLEGTAIAWGSIGSAGQVAIHQGSNASLSSNGLILLPLSYVYGVLRSSFINQTTQLTRTICGNVSLKKFVESLPFLEHSLTQYLTISNKKSMMGGVDTNSNENKIINHIAETLSIERSLLSPDTKLKDYGVDSMVSIQLKTWIDQEFGKTQIINHSQISNGSINSIIETIQRSKN